MLKKKVGVSLTSAIKLFSSGEVSVSRFVHTNLSTAAEEPSNSS